jgi:Arc/MetJ-type ribon-helix-helix transcriptional regulator
MASVSVRLTDQELAFLDRQTRKQGLRTRSDCLRRLLQTEALRERADLAQLLLDGAASPRSDWKQDELEDIYRKAKALVARRRSALRRNGKRAKR